MLVIIFKMTERKISEEKREKSGPCCMLIVVPIKLETQVFYVFDLLLFVL